jgi:hypothetical protein
MKLTIETNKGNFDLQEGEFIINYGFQNFNDEGYYFNYCLLFLYQKNIRSEFSDLMKIDKIIWGDGVEINIFENAERIGCLTNSGIVGANKKLKNVELLNLIDKQSFNKAENETKIFARDTKKELDKSLLLELQINKAKLQLELENTRALLRKAKKD